MHLVITHRDGRYVRRVAQTSGLDVASLDSYRAAHTKEDGLVLRFGGLRITDIERGCRQLVSAAQMPQKSGSY